MNTSPTTILQFDGVSLRYGEAAAVLHDIDLRLEAGSFYFLSGPTGAGKTSLLRLMSLSVPPSTGAMHLFGRDIAALDRAELAALRQRIGVVFQDFRLLEHLSAFDNVALPLRINGAEEDQTARFVADMLGWLGLADKLTALPADLSMGQRQMICIARAVVSKPRLLLADEPTSNIDGKNTERLMNLFIQLHKLGTAVVFATHSRALLDRYPYPILEMTAGRLRATRRPAAAITAAEPAPPERMPEPAPPDPGTPPDPGMPPDPGTPESATKEPPTGAADALAADASTTQKPGPRKADPRKANRKKTRPTKKPHPEKSDRPADPERDAAKMARDAVETGRDAGETVDEAADTGRDAGETVDEAADTGRDAPPGGRRTVGD